jgi:small subunit ribosomal protein S6
MPLYDIMLMLKPMVTRESAAELVARVARRAYQRNGVVTDLKSFGKVHLGYGIMKLDGRHLQVRPDSPLFICTLLVKPRIPLALDLVTARNGDDLIRLARLMRKGRNG